MPAGTESGRGREPPGASQVWEGECLKVTSRRGTSETHTHNKTHGNTSHTLSHSHKHTSHWTCSGKE